MATKLIKIPLIFLSSLIGCLLSSQVSFLIWQSFRVFMISNKFILACVIFQYILSLFILGGEFLYGTNIAVFLVGSTLPCLVPVLFHTTIFLCGQYFYTDFKRYNLLSFLFTLSYFFAVVFHTTISRSHFTGFFIEITFLITIKANKAPSISATI